MREDERPYRELPDTDLYSAIRDNAAHLAALLEEAGERNTAIKASLSDSDMALGSLIRALWDVGSERLDDIYGKGVARDAGG